MSGASNGGTAFPPGFVWSEEEGRPVYRGTNAPETTPYRRWLKLWLRYGGDPDAPEAMHVKQRVAEIEGEQAERRARGL